MELKPKWQYKYKGRKMDFVGKGIKAVKVKDKDIAFNKLERKIQNQLSKMGFYRGRAAVKKTVKNI